MAQKAKSVDKLSPCRTTPAKPKPKGRLPGGVRTQRVINSDHAQSREGQSRSKA
jgi:hypothetical protein